LTIIREQKETIEKVSSALLSPPRVFSSNLSPALPQLSQKTSLEENAFRKVLGEERAKFDKRILRNKNMLRRRSDEFEICSPPPFQLLLLSLCLSHVVGVRDELLCEWSEIGTVLLLSHPHDPLVNVLEKYFLPPLSETNKTSHLPLVAEHVYSFQRQRNSPRDDTCERCPLPSPPL
jgi:hypothetical protein